MCRYILGKILVSKRNHLDCMLWSVIYINVLMINLVSLFWPLFLASSEISCGNVSEQTQKKVWWDGAVHRGQEIDQVLEEAATRSVGSFVPRFLEERAQPACLFLSEIHL